MCIDITATVASVSGYFVGLFYGFVTTIVKAISTGDKDVLIELFITAVVLWLSSVILIRLIRSIYGTLKLVFKLLVLLALALMGTYAYFNGLNALQAQLTNNGLYFFKSYTSKIGQSVVKANNYLDRECLQYVGKYLHKEQ